MVRAQYFDGVSDVTVTAHTEDRYPTQSCGHLLDQKELNRAIETVARMLGRRLALALADPNQVCVKLGALCVDLIKGDPDLQGEVTRETLSRALGINPDLFVQVFGEENGSVSS